MPVNRGTSDGRAFRGLGHLRRRFHHRLVDRLQILDGVVGNVSSRAQSEFRGVKGLKRGPVGSGPIVVAGYLPMSSRLVLVGLGDQRIDLVVKKGREQ